ncbi:DUF5107 domain-containing protein, partial [Gemmatimonadota bacterium]
MSGKLFRSGLFLSMVFISAIALRPLCAEQSSVRLWEEELVLPTYILGADNLNPMFYGGKVHQSTKGRVYPYPLMDKLTDDRKDVGYNAVYLENDYVKICIVPQLGGRLFSALDKTNGYDFFYRQSVIKPALIGVLGAWISGGVEWNIPHHHRTTTYIECDYRLEENPDGSKTVWLGEIERRHRTKWMVGLTLHPDKSYIETTVKYFNRTPYAQSFLYWANVAVHADSSYQIIFPPGTEYATYHGKTEFSAWPVSHSTYRGVDYSGGVDLSWWKNHPSPVSWFCWNSPEDFLAGYNHGKKAGVVHVANHHLVPGKKLWEWGPGPVGRMWDKMLTETDGSYIELMVGSYSDNQPDYSWCQPYMVKEVKQYWYPIREIKGVKDANTEACVNLEITPENRVLMGFNTTAEHKNARVVLQASGKTVFEETIDIEPGNPYLKEIEFPGNAEAKELLLSLILSSNEELISYRELPKAGNPMPDPVRRPPPPEEIETNDELYYTGIWLEQLHNPDYQSDIYYEEALRRDPGDYRSNTALGILYNKRGMFKDAEKRLKIAVDRASKNYTRPKDGEALYYLGVALKAQGRFDESYDAFFRAAWCYAWYSSAYYSLAELACLKGDFRSTLELVERSLSTNALNTKAQNLKVAALRKLGRTEEAVETAGETLVADPLNYRARNELVILGSLVESGKDSGEQTLLLKSLLRGEVQSYLELAVDYGNCGLWDEAIEVLSRAAVECAKGKSVLPMVYYYLGYYHEMNGEQKEASKFYRLGGQMPADYCFPFRLESIEVLSRAMQHDPTDASAPYYLGNLLYDSQPEKAIKQWEKARSLDDKFYLVHRNLGLAYAQTHGDLDGAVAGMEKAIALNRTDPKLLSEMDILYEAGGRSDEKRLKLLESNYETVIKRDDVFTQLLKLYLLLGRYDKVIDDLGKHHFRLWEHSKRTIRNVYIDAYLLRGNKRLNEKKYPEALKDFRKALEYPDNLEVGRPYGRGREPEVFYNIGNTLGAMGEGAEAVEMFENALDGKGRGSETGFFRGLALRKLGREDRAGRIFESLINAGRRMLDEKPPGLSFASFGEKHALRLHQADA